MTYPYGTVLRNEASGCLGVEVMVVHWMEPMFLGLVLDDGSEHLAWGWEPEHGGPGARTGFFGLLCVQDKRAEWKEDA